MLGQNPTNTGSAKEVPVINTVSAVPLRRVSQDEIRRYTPAGSVFAWAGPEAPFGFVFCDGASYNIATQPEFKILKEAIGYQFGGSGNDFNVPDLRSRAIRGVGPQAGLTTFSRGDTGGVEDITLVDTQLPPHTHLVAKNSLNQPLENMSGKDVFFHNDITQEAGKASNPTFAFAGIPQRMPTENFYAYPEPSQRNPLHKDGMRNDAINIENPYLALNYIIKI